MSIDIRAHSFVHSMATVLSGVYGLLFAVVLLVQTVTLARADGEVATYYVRDINGRVIAEYDQEGQLRHVNIYGTDLIGRFQPSSYIMLLQNGIEVKRYVVIADALKDIAADDDAVGTYELRVCSGSTDVIADETITVNADVQCISITGDGVCIQGETTIQIAE